MTITTYTNLQTAVASWSKRTDLTTLIPDFITLGEIRLTRKMRVRAMETTGTLTCVAGTATVAMPSNYRAFKRIYVDGNPKQKLEYASGEILFSTYAGSDQGKPKQFSFQADNLILGPTPDSAYSLPYLAYIAPTALSGSTATNTLFPRFADIYLFASLAELFDYLEDDASFQKYMAKMNLAIQEAQVEDDMDRHSGSTLRARSDTGNP